MTPNARILKDDAGNFKIGFIDDSEAIRDLLHPVLLRDADKNGFAANVMQKGEVFHFVVLLKLGLSYKFWWMPFRQCLSGPAADFEEFAALIDLMCGTSYFPRTMQEAYRWQIRATHPDWPTELDQTAWELFETSFALIRLRPKSSN